MDQVRFGILSTAKIARRKVIPGIRRARNADVVAIASRDLGLAQAVASDHGIAQAFGSYEELLASDDVDAVYIPLPNDLHAEWTIKAAAAGKHVLCEKPLALTVAQAREMAEACDTAGVKLAEAFMYRHHPVWVEAVRIVRSGEIGELQAVQSFFSYFNDDPADIRNRLDNGGGALLDIGCYCISVSRLLFGAEPTRTRGAVRRDRDLGIDTLTSAVLEFPMGGHATFSCSTRAEPHQGVSIVGATGRLELDIPFNIPPDRTAELRLTRGGDPPVAPNTEVHMFGPADHYTLQAESFASSILQGRELAVPIEDAFANLAVIEAVFANGQD